MPPAPQDDDVHDYDEASIALHAKHHGKLEIASKVSLASRRDLSLAYTPGVAAVCRAIARDPSRARDLTIKGNTVAIVSDGSAILGIGNLGAAAAIPVMEGKAILFREFAGVDAFPLCLDTQDTDAIVATVKAIAPVFGGINLEDISAPRCFEIEERLSGIGIPVFHDDQHGTAIVVVAATLNALKVTGKDLGACRVVFNGSGASALGCARLLLSAAEHGLLPAPADIVMCDSKGILHLERTDLNPHKREIAERTNAAGLRGLLAVAMEGADIFIGLSQGNTVSDAMVRSMKRNAIVFAMANPTPEIMPALARTAGAAIVGSGRSDLPNQINNVLAFPGIFRGALDAGARRITLEMKIEAARTLAAYVTAPSAEQILPDPLDRKVAYVVARAVEAAARASGAV
jgi:malate dehydrogenase (oxaloacetate-decarboxylating)